MSSTRPLPAPIIALVAVAVACGGERTPGARDTIGAPMATVELQGEVLPLVADTLVPAVVTEPTATDTDDPAIYVDPADPARSFVIGTDKGDSTGGVYAFRLDGRIDRARTVTPLQRMNNVDIEYGLAGPNGAIDIAVATERNRMMLRVFALPSMRPIDGGGIPVFDGDQARAPMGVALYRRPSDGAVFAIVGGKGGPTDGTYLWQYRLEVDGSGTVRGTKVRAFGGYSGQKEIEAIVVDDELGYVYYSDEGVGVRKYHADPDAGSAELALFATSGVAEDHEGLAVYRRDDGTGYLILSDQQAQRIHVFTREGSPGNPHAHRRLAVIPVKALETDGLEVTAKSLGPTFPRGLLVMMSTDQTFHFYRWEDVEAAISRAPGARP